MEKLTPLGDKVRALICVGPGEIDQDALSFTRDFIGAMNFYPVIFHVFLLEVSQKTTDQLLTKVRDGIDIENTELRSIEGEVMVEIQRELKRQVYQVIILGTTERNPELPPSRLCQDIANRVGISVLLKRNPLPEINEILICTGGHQASNIAVKWGIQLAQATHANVTILHVALNVPTMYTGLRVFEEDLFQTHCSRNARKYPQFDFDHTRGDIVGF